jgi:hypothetical protein
LLGADALELRLLRLDARVYVQHLLGQLLQLLVLQRALAGFLGGTVAESEGGLLALSLQAGDDPLLALHAQKLLRLELRVARAPA